MYFPINETRIIAQRTLRTGIGQAVMGYPVIPVLLFLFTGCGYGQFQTAKTVPRGNVVLTGGITGLVNENSESRGIQPGAFPSELNIRVGLHERMDLGVGLFLLTGIQADAKVNVLPVSWNLALAVQSGAGVGVDPTGFDVGRVSWTLRVPVNVLVSYRVTGWLTPYAGAGYQFWWLFNRPRPDVELETGFEWVEREGYGDGVVRLAGGLAFRTGERWTMLVEYAALIPVVNDPGDNYTFVLNHHFGIAMQRMFGKARK